MANRNIPLRGPGYEPTGPAWDRATPAARRTYWRRLGDYALGVKRDEIRRGIGADGEKLDPVKPSSRPDGATGKPLDPHYGASRTVRLLAVAVGITGATLFWRGHGRRSWTEILGYHADGLVRGAPVRDTIGISPAGVKKVQAEGKELWKRQTRGAVKPPVTPPPVTPPPPPPAKGVYPPRVRPKAGSRTILVYEEDGPKPKKVKRASFPTDAEKRARARAEAERLRLEKEKAEAEARAKAKAEKERLERERLAREKAERERLAQAERARARAEKARLEAERAAAELAARVAQEAAWEQARQQALAKAQSSAGPVLPGRPIAERIAAYAAGDAKVKAVHAIAAKLAETEKALQKESEGYIKVIMARPSQAKVSVAMKGMNGLSDRYLAAKNEARAAIEDVLKTDTPVALAWKHAPLDSKDRPLDPLDAATRARAEKGLRWLEQVTRRGDADAMETGFGQAQPGQDDRAHYHNMYGSARGYIRVKPDEGTDVVVHEMGHFLEYRLTAGGRKAGDVVKEFLAHRVGDEKPVKMADVAPKANYEAHELGRKDHFDNVFSEADAYYTGKVYSDGATEVLSMGLQLLYNDPAKFAKGDPEYFKLVVGILDGSLR